MALRGHQTTGHDHHPDRLHPPSSAARHDPVPYAIAAIDPQWSNQ
jgi:hypothetical protein